ncbi:MAG TPA: alpha/beta fold hydrolase [Longimicrobium sp.]|nr:alpha/beta fold hydrolase [Longimicrobium sp.]
MRRKILLMSAIPFLLAACAGQRNGADDVPDTTRHVDAMAREHAHETPTPSPAALAEPAVPVDTQTVTYGTVDGKAARGYLAAPAAASGATLPGVILVHEWWGLNDNIRAMARQLAGEGYRVLAVDMYGGQVATTPQEAQAYMREVVADPDRGSAHLASAALYLRQQPRAGKLGIMGWCFGGGWALQGALELPERIDAAVMYYGRVVTDRARLARLDAPLLGHFGAEDRGIPVDSVRAMEGALRELGKEVTIHVYPGAGHAFANPSGQSYNARAAEQAWERTKEFLARTLK